MGLIKIGLLLIATSVLAKIYDYLTSASPHPEVSHDIMVNPWLECIDAHRVEFGLAAFALIVIALALVYFGSKCCGFKASHAPEISRVVDIISQICENGQQGGLGVDATHTLGQQVQYLRVLLGIKSKSA